MFSAFHCYLVSTGTFFIPTRARLVAVCDPFSAAIHWKSPVLITPHM